MSLHGIIVACVLTMLLPAARAQSADANTATLAELERVSGIGPSMAAKLLDERRNGPFRDWRDLMRRVGGIGDSRAAKLSAAGLTVDGVGYHGTMPQPKP